MAESLIIHFIGTDKEKVREAINSFGEHIGSAWQAPNKDSHRITIYPYDEILSEYENDELLEVENKLGGSPQYSFCFELRRTKQNEACDMVKKFIVERLNFSQYIVNDCIGKIWNKAEIVANECEFLNEYYNRKMT